MALDARTRNVSLPLSLSPSLHPSLPPSLFLLPSLPPPARSSAHEQRRVATSEPQQPQRSNDDLEVLDQAKHESDLPSCALG